MRRRSAPIVTYLVIYAAMNLGAFAVIIAVARKTRSAEISSMGGLFSYMPGLTVAMTIFLASLAGIPPLGGWYAKFSVWYGAGRRRHRARATRWRSIMAVNTVIAAYYYLNVAKTMWFDPAPDGDVTPVKVPAGLTGAIVLAGVATIVLGVFPGLITDISQLRTRPSPRSAADAGPGWLSMAGRDRRAGRAREHRAVRDRIARSGSIRFDEYMDLALYAPDEGFFATGGGAGRGGADFLTSPEVGPLFGALVGRVPGPPLGGAGLSRPVRGRRGGRRSWRAGHGGAGGVAALSRRRCATCWSSAPRSCASASASTCRWGTPSRCSAPTPDVEDPGRPCPGRGIGPLLCSLEDLPAEPFDGVVLANELLDNVPFRLAGAPGRRLARGAGHPGRRPS